MIDWIEERSVPIDQLVAGAAGKEWKIHFLRRVLQSEGKFRNPLIVVPAGDSFRVLVGTNRLLALRAEGITSAQDVLVVGSIEGMIRAMSNHYVPKLSPDEVVSHIVNGSPA